MTDEKSIPTQPDKGQSLEKGLNSLPDFNFTPPPPPPQSTSQQHPSDNKDSNA